MYILCYTSTQSVTVVRRRFRTKFSKKPSGKEMYIRVVQIALERGCLSSQERKCGGRPLFLAENVERFRISPCIVQIKSFFKFHNQ